MMKTKACIFDLDGVIVDTAKYHFLAWKRLADELDIPFDEQDNERLKGVSRMQSLDIILELGNRQLAEEEKVRLATRKNNWYKEYVSHMDASEILPGVQEFLQALKQQGIFCVLASGSRNAPAVIRNVGLREAFDAIVDIEKVAHPKPFPDLFLQGAVAVDQPPEHCVVFEDAAAGIEAAKSAGMYAIGVGLEQNLPGSDQVIPGFANAGVEILP